LVFDDDVTLLGIFLRADASTTNQDLMNNVLKYIQAGSFEYNRPSSLNATANNADNAADEMDAVSEIFYENSWSYIY